MVQNLRLTAGAAVLLLAAGTAWAQPYAAAPVPPPPFPPVPPCMMPSGMMPYMCAQAPAPAPCGTGNLTSSTTVAELMKLYRMLYRQGKHEEAAAVARQVMGLNPIVGHTALALAGRACCQESAHAAAHGCCAEGYACGGCCTGCGPCPGCCVTGVCGSTCCDKPCAAAKDCACGADCKCCKGDKSACNCGKSCRCGKPTKAAAGCACHGTITVAVPVPFMMSPPWPQLPQVPPVMVFRHNPMCPASSCANSTEMVVPFCCCGKAPCKPCHGPACHDGHGAEACEAHDAHHEDCPPVCITASGSRVQITTPAVHVECDRVISLSRAGRVCLEGNVSVEFRREGRPAAISAEHISLGLADGSYEIDCASAPCTAPAQAPETGCGHGATGTAKPCSHEETSRQLFNFYTGLSR